MCYAREVTELLIKLYYIMMVKKVSQKHSKKDYFPVFLNYKYKFS